MGGLQKEWLIFRKQVISPDAPDVQVREMKLAFHAGIAAFFKEVPSVH